MYLRGYLQGSENGRELRLTETEYIFLRYLEQTSVLISEVDGQWQYNTLLFQ